MNALQVSIVRHTKNYEAMLEFYRDGLGLQITEEWDEPDDRGTLLAFDGKAGSTVIEVIDLEDEAVPGVKPINVALSIQVEDADSLHDELIKRGISIARGLEDAPWGHRSFGIDDPDGFRIWFYHDMNK
jgi:uncharacterized glyoxalase superfamily protein PhnB